MFILGPTGQLVLLEVDSGCPRSRLSSKASRLSVWCVGSCIHLFCRRRWQICQSHVARWVSGLSRLWELMCLGRSRWNRVDHQISCIYLLLQWGCVSWDHSLGFLVESWVSSGGRPIRHWSLQRSLNTNKTWRPLFLNVMFWYYFCYNIVFSCRSAAGLFPLNVCNSKR